jgi:hypothetical protein
MVIYHDFVILVRFINETPFIILRSGIVLNSGIVLEKFFCQYPYFFNLQLVEYFLCMLKNFRCFPAYHRKSVTLSLFVTRNLHIAVVKLYHHREC